MPVAWRPPVEFPCDDDDDDDEDNDDGVVVAAALAEAVLVAPKRRDMLLMLRRPLLRLLLVVPPPPFLDCRLHRYHIRIAQPKNKSTFQSEGWLFGCDEELSPDSPCASRYFLEKGGGAGPGLGYHFAFRAWPTCELTDASSPSNSAPQEENNVRGWRVDA